jgi:hypothetical protein
MANFKVNFVSTNNSLSLTKCCCPNIVNVVCSDMELAKEYSVYFDDTSSYRAQVFPAKYTFIAEGRLTGFKIVNKGLGYDSAPAVVISGGGARVNATAIAKISEITLSNGTKTKVVSEIQITNPGSGYTSLPLVTIFGGGGTDASALPVIGDIIKNLSFFVAFGCDDKKMPIPTPYPSNTPTITPTNTVTPTPTRPELSI